MKHSIRAKKSLGQHFLNSKHVLEQIISAGNIRIGEHILEIGPGTGVLTEELLKKGARVTAVEKDIRSYEVLKEKFAQQIEDGQLILKEGDILEIPNEQFSIFNNSQVTYSVIANIPYYITGAILEKFLEHEPRPDRMILLVQKEVAERIVARDGKESILSISVKAFGKPKIIAKVPPGAFTPPPSVDSAILAISDITDEQFTKLYSNKKPKDVDISRFFDIVKTGFGHKRKYLKSNLVPKFDKNDIENAWEKLNLDGKIRSEDMLLEDWIGLSTEVKNTA